MENKYINRLINETSSYLQEHAHQSINWYTWGDEALERAKAENKMLFVSIGYSACHWCRKMSTECFDNETIATILNKYYVSIIVDKEERPDLDQIYLNAVQLMTDNAGWPLNCFMLPDGVPIFGGTFFNSEQFTNILQSLQDTYQNESEKVIDVANDMRKALQNIDIISSKEKVRKFTSNDIKLIVEPWRRKFDNIYGGTQNPPKFPLPNGKEFLLYAAYYFDDKEIKQHLELTLDKMAQGAIYDQLEGGFSRYTVDKKWCMPHFEMMLYDNAQLITLYAKSYRFFQKELYKKIVEQTIDFMLLRMRSDEGAYYCSVDADSDGNEGQYYMWTWEEWCNTLKDDAQLAAAYFGVTEQGNYSNGLNVLYIATDEAELAAKYSITVDELRIRIDYIKQTLYDERNRSPFPKTDKKIIASWNSLMLMALIEAFIALGNQKYLDEAKIIADYIKEHLMYNNGCIYRTVTSKNNIPGFLDDYASVIKGFLLLYQVTADQQYLQSIKPLADYAIKHFYDEKSGMFFYISDEQRLPMGRKMDFIDKAMPSSCSEMTQALMLLARIFEDSMYKDMAIQMLTNVKSQMYGAGPFISNWGRLLFFVVFEPIIVRVSGNGYSETIQEIRRHFWPNVLVYPTSINEPADSELSIQINTKQGKKLNVDLDILTELSAEYKRVGLK